MIKFAVSRPNDRMVSIRNGLKTLDWESDPILNRYGIKIANQMLTVSSSVALILVVMLIWDCRPKLVFLTPQLCNSISQSSHLGSPGAGISRIVNFSMAILCL